jgi:DNA-binding transcriptional LysR family regulator
MLARTGAEPRGVLKVSMPLAYGRPLVISRLAELLDRYAALSIEANVSDRRAELIEEGYDSRSGSASFPIPGWSPDASIPLDSSSAPRPGIYDARYARLARRPGGALLRCLAIRLQRSSDAVAPHHRRATL